MTQFDIAFVYALTEISNRRDPEGTKSEPQHKHLDTQRF